MTDRHKPGKSRKISIRIPETGGKMIDDLAAENDITFSHQVRRMLLYAAEKMPRNFTPRRRRPPTQANT